MLNAFRHQRENHEQLINSRQAASKCSTPFGIRGKITLRDEEFIRGRNLVLNAFRHQRENHDIGLAGELRKVRCSTPFGIRGKITGRLGRADQTTGPVLNAFRHQRENHSSPRFLSPMAYPVLNAFRHQRENHDNPDRPPRAVTMCSTPFGIRGKITADTWLYVPCHQGCSTPFGIRGKITSRDWVRPEVTTGAQRLSASEGKSR